MSGGIPSWAVKGAKVVCVDATYEPIPGFESDALTKGATYTIRGVAPEDSDGRFGLLLEEARAAFERDGFGYVIDRFRPLVTRTQEQDMELFTPLLDPPLVRIPHHGEVA